MLVEMPVYKRFAQLHIQHGRRMALKINSAFFTYVGLRSFRNNAQKSQSFGTARVSVRDVAARAGQSKRTVEGNLPLLEQWGVVFADPSPGAMTTFTFIDEPKLFADDAKESGAERAKGLVEMDNIAVTQAARGDAAREARGHRPPRPVASTPAVGCDTPPQHVADTSATRRGPVAPENYENYKKARTPSSDGVRSLATRTYCESTNNAALPAEIAGPLQQLAAEKAMPPARMTPAEEQARRQKLQRQLAVPPKRAPRPYRPTTGEAWDEKEREARAKATVMLKDHRKQQAAQRAAHCEERR